MGWCFRRVLDLTGVHGSELCRGDEGFRSHRVPFFRLRGDFLFLKGLIMGLLPLGCAPKCKCASNRASAAQGLPRCERQ